MERAVTALSATDFQRINGYSNSFWGWRGEEEQLQHRMAAANLTVSRSFNDQSSPLDHYKRLTMYNKIQKSDGAIKLINEEDIAPPFNIDGLIDLKYQRIDLQLKLLYTHVLVDIPYNIPTAS